VTWLSIVSNSSVIEGHYAGMSKMTIFDSSSTIIQQSTIMSLYQWTGKWFKYCTL